MKDDKLQHYGVKGMKWGVRRYQPYPKGKKGTFKGTTVNKSNNKNTSSRMSTSAKLPNGDTIKIEQNKDPILAKVLGRVSSNIREEQKKTKIFTITDSNGSKVGNGQIYRESKDELNLVWLGVNRKNRSKGIGTAAVTAAYLYAQKEGIPKLTLEVPGSSPDALHIYKKLGFVEKEKLSEDDLWGGLTAMELRMPNKQDTIKHYGVKGMKWGVRRYQPYPKGKGPKGKFLGKVKKKAVEGRIGQEIRSRKRSMDMLRKSKNADNMSTKEIRSHAKRAQLESRMSKLATTDKEKKDYRNRVRMSDQEIQRKVDRLQQKEILRRESEAVTQTERAAGKAIVEFAHNMITSQIVGEKELGESIIDSLNSASKTYDDVKKNRKKKG